MRVCVCACVSADIQHERVKIKSAAVIIIKLWRQRIHVVNNFVATAFREITLCRV